MSCRDGCVRLPVPPDGVITMRFLTSALAFLVLLPAVASARTLVHAGALIDGVSDDVRSEVTVVIEDGRFVEVRDGYLEAGPEDEVLDLKGHTVLPGLMDMPPRRLGRG